MLRDARRNVLLAGNLTAADGACTGHDGLAATLLCIGVSLVRYDGQMHSWRTTFLRHDYDLRAGDPLEEVRRLLDRRAGRSPNDPGSGRDRLSSLLRRGFMAAAERKALLERAVAATAPGQTPGQFPQVGGLAFSFDATRQPIVFRGNPGTGQATLVTEGQRVRSLALKDAEGNTLDVIVQDGWLVGDPNRLIRLVTLNFLADDPDNDGLGGDNYPFPTYAVGRLDLNVGEQAALGEYLQATFPVGRRAAFNERDTKPGQDSRIQNLAFRSDTVLAPPVVPPGSVHLRPVGTIGGLGAEITAYDPATQRLFVTGNTLDILDVRNPAAPVRLASVDLSAFGATVTSVAVKNGVVAVAVAANPVTAPGRVVFLDADGTVLGSVVVGSLPDMLTFTPDGLKVLVANEGEALNIADPSVNNPEGSVSIITLNRADLGASTVQTADFRAFNARRAELIGRGVRIFPTAPTVAQDLEPEFITVLPDGLMAVVTLQENNAVAVINIATATVTEIRPLGAKGHGLGLPTVESLEFPTLPPLGVTEAGQLIRLGGFSGLFFEGTNPANGNLRFITHTDQGPNGEPGSGTVWHFSSRMTRTLQPNCTTTGALRRRMADPALARLARGVFPQCGSHSPFLIEQRARSRFRWRSKGPAASCSAEGRGGDEGWPLRASVTSPSFVGPTRATS